MYFCPMPQRVTFYGFYWFPYLAGKKSYDA